jgi:acyl carrier protein
MKSILKDENTFLEFTANELMVSLDEINFETEFRSISSWSSLNALIYISSVNEETAVFISSADLAQLVSIRDLYNLILSRSNGTI